MTGREAGGLAGCVVARVTRALVVVGRVEGRGLGLGEEVGRDVVAARVVAGGAAAGMVSGGAVAGRRCQTRVRQVLKT